MLRALLRLVRPALDRATFARENQALRDAGRALSRLRDPDSLVDVVRDLRPVRGGVTGFERLLFEASWRSWQSSLTRRRQSPCRPPHGTHLSALAASAKQPIAAIRFES
jgi:hypothetical protein